MLTEELINQYGEQFVELFQRLEMSTINDIARRLRKSERWTETAELQAKSLRDLGYSTERIRVEVLRKLRANPEYIKFVDANTIESKRAIQKFINETRAELKKTAPDFYTEVGNMAFNDDLRMWESVGETLPTGSALPQMIDAMAKRSTGELLDLTKSTAFKFQSAMVKSQNAFRTIMNDTIASVLPGTKSATQAVSEAVKAMCASGLRTIDYASGRTYQLDVAARMVTRTSCAQIAGDISVQNIKTTGVDYVEISSHWGARPSHQVWQGRIIPYKDLESVTGYGTGAGLCGYNCRHTFYPFWPGISEPNKWPPEPAPKMINGKTYTYYESTQQQRKMERGIRAMKRMKNAGEDIPQSAITQATREYKAFSAAADIKLHQEYLIVYKKT